ncbi:MAG: hypothetical protein L3J26_12640 [Candidatus Polarisedimenticolaceae bacterium]|nr:hypothetical protein [Candidatus Polarisedimenticolaceae bacterium]
MNYNLVLSELEQASTFELFRLQSAINTLLEDPARIAAIKHQLHPGMEISYFHGQENRLVSARLLEIRKTRAVIQEDGSSKRWTIPLYTINLEQSDTDLAPQKQGVDRLSLRIDDRVGFRGKHNEELFGAVIKLNPKRAKIRVADTIWSVPYSMLFTVIDGEQGADLFIPATLPDR